MSSICSKNDFETVKQRLVAEGIWDYFVFPSISWQPKGHRIAGIIEDIQLRAATVMFIDDNPMNRNEALHVTPDVQIADEHFLPSLLADPRFKGKDDRALTRLKQYKLLERRRDDQSRFDENLDFLRSSGIQVTLEYDIEPHLDRAVELINRTNQLNFTKKRLPEDPGAARAQLLGELRARNVQAALIHVRDNYGDYGFIGFYLLFVHSNRLVHFCFSCRTMGMGVESWVYNRLNRPAVHIVGEVLTDLSAAEPQIDWINMAGATGQAHNQPSFGRVYIRGDCEMQAMAHYMASGATDIASDFIFNRAGLPVPVNHTLFFTAALDGLSESALQAASLLGYTRQDFQCAATSDPKPFDTYLYSFWADGLYATYAHGKTGLRLPFGVYGLNNGSDLRKVSTEQIFVRFNEPGMATKFEALKAEYDYLGVSLNAKEAGGGTQFTRNLARIFGAAPRESRSYVLLACEVTYDEAGAPRPVPHFKALNHATRQVAAAWPNVRCLAVEDFVREPREIIDAAHFDRQLYYRIYQHIVADQRMATLEAAE